MPSAHTLTICLLFYFLFCSVLSCPFHCTIPPTHCVNTTSFPTLHPLNFFTALAVLAGLAVKVLLRPLSRREIKFSLMLFRCVYESSRHCTLLYRTLLYCTVPYCAQLCSAALSTPYYTHYTMVCFAVLYCTVLHCSHHALCKNCKSVRWVLFWLLFVADFLINHLRSISFVGIFLFWLSVFWPLFSNLPLPIPSPTPPLFLSPTAPLILSPVSPLALSLSSHLPLPYLSSHLPLPLPSLPIPSLLPRPQGAVSRGLPIDSLTSEKRDYQDSGKLAQTGKLSLSISFSFLLYLFPSFSLSISLSFHLYLSICIYLSLFLSFPLSFHLSLFPSLSIYLYIYISLSLFSFSLSLSSLYLSLIFFLFFLF